MKQIYIHGLGQVSDSWNKVIELLHTTENSICPNLSKLILEAGITYQNLYAGFSAMCDKIEEPISLCGLSLGGVLALNYTIDHPEKVEKLVLIAAQYKMPKRLLRFQNILFRFMPKSMFQQMGFGKSDFLGLCKTMMELDFSYSLDKICCPTLIVCGEKDSANKKASIELADMLSDAELRMIESVGHEINIEAPEKLAELLGEFYN